MNGHPRFVFSIPYKAALETNMTPGGKWMPLMKRTVRLESGAWLLLKKAAVRATAAASSLVSTALPKFPMEEAGAWLFRNTAKMLPWRSLTAITIPGSFTAAVALVTIARTSSEVNAALFGARPASGSCPRATIPHARIAIASKFAL